MKTLVTGGAGFIGSHLVERLVALGHDIVVLDNLRCGNKLPAEVVAAVEWIEGDVRDADIVLAATAGCRLVFHLAAVLGVDVVADHPVETMETETLGLRNVTEAAMRHRVERVIYASTSGVYGRAAIERAVSEDFEVSPGTSYAIAKRYNEIYLASLFAARGLKSNSARLFNVYGPRQDERMVIPRFFDLARRGEPLIVFGTGAQTRDFTYIDDAVEAFIRLAEIDAACEIVNVATGIEHAIEDVARRIVKLTGSSSEIKHITPPANRYDYEVDRRVGSVEKLTKLTGQSPATPLDEGLARTYRSLSQPPVGRS